MHFTLSSAAVTISFTRQFSVHAGDLLPSVAFRGPFNISHLTNLPWRFHRTLSVQLQQAGQPGEALRSRSRTFSHPLYLFANMNTALIFLKPHAASDVVERFVRDHLASAKVRTPPTLRGFLFSVHARASALRLCSPRAAHVLSSDCAPPSVLIYLYFSTFSLNNFGNDQ